MGGASDCPVSTVRLRAWPQDPAHIATHALALRRQAWPTSEEWHALRCASTDY
jgi:hypothetical protein